MLILCFLMFSDTLFQSPDCIFRFFCVGSIFIFWPTFLFSTSSFQLTTLTLLHKNKYCSRIAKRHYLSVERWISTNVSRKPSQYANWSNMCLKLWIIWNGKARYKAGHHRCSLRFVVLAGDRHTDVGIQDQRLEKCQSSLAADWIPK